MSDIDVLLALKYDSCEAADKCEPCKGVRQMAIDEITRLRQALTGVSTCSSCEMCRNVALKALE